METEQKLYDYFDGLDIAHDTFEHAPAMTAEDLHDPRTNALDFPVKNLFLRDKKKQNYWLVTVHLYSDPVDLKALRHVLEAKGNLSFGNADDLMDMLGVTPGSVTPYALLNDTEKRVRFILDDRARSAKSISGHPMRNDKTTTVSMDDFDKFCAAIEHEQQLMTLPLKKGA